MKPEGWNPDQACQEMAALFAQADRIMQLRYLSKTKAVSKSDRTRKKDPRNFVTRV
jgi:hypothetical protein